MRAGPGETLSRRVRCASVGATTVTVAVAAHGAAGGGWPTGSALTLLACFAAVLSSVTVAVPALRRGGLVLVPLLALGQIGAHAALAVSGGHHAGGETLGLSPQMIAAHAVALGLCAALIAAAERIGPAAAAALRAVVAAIFASLPVAERPRIWLSVTDIHPVAASVGRGVQPRRGPPALV